MPPPCPASYAMSVEYSQERAKEKAAKQTSSSKKDEEKSKKKIITTEVVSDDMSRVADAAKIVGE